MAQEMLLFLNVGSQLNYLLNPNNFGTRNNALINSICRDFLTVIKGVVKIMFFLKMRNYDFILIRNAYN